MTQSDLFRKQFTSHKAHFYLFWTQKPFLSINSSKCRKLPFLKYSLNCFVNPKYTRSLEPWHLFLNHCTSNVHCTRSWKKLRKILIFYWTPNVWNITSEVNTMCFSNVKLIISADSRLERRRRKRTLLFYINYRSIKHKAWWTKRLQLNKITALGKYVKQHSICFSSSL
jgi:hypothetical protein